MLKALQKKKHNAAREKHVRACVWEGGHVCVRACVRGIFAVQARPKKIIKSAALLASTACPLFSSKKEGGGKEGFSSLLTSKKRRDLSHFLFVWQDKKKGQLTLFAENKKRWGSHIFADNPSQSPARHGVVFGEAVYYHRIAVFFPLLLFFLFIYWLGQAFCSRRVAVFFLFIGQASYTSSLRPHTVVSKGLIH